MAIQNGNNFFSPIQNEPNIQTDDACLNELKNSRSPSKKQNILMTCIRCTFYNTLQYAYLPIAT
ncbi:15588_t:CDS:2 [Funneliformis geosporum]|nr:15588_t:CDS:2 [Funneliformis geosporum]